MPELVLLDGGKLLSVFGREPNASETHLFPLAEMAAYLDGQGHRVLVADVARTAPHRVQIETIVPTEWIRVIRVVREPDPSFHELKEPYLEIDNAVLTPEQAGQKIVDHMRGVPIAKP